MLLPIEHLSRFSTIQGKYHSSINCLLVQGLLMMFVNLLSLLVCRACPTDFVIPASKYRKAIYGTQISAGMRFGMMFETEESGKRRYYSNRFVCQIVNT